MLASVSEAGGEVRTLSLIHVHTGEKLTITYKKDGRYIPSAMTRINYLLRDWRRDKVIKIDPRTIDLMWELYADLGAREPIRIICGYRSPETNGMLARIGRHVAKESQHTSGKAIDFYLPDVPLSKLRNSAIVREVGGVGYYPAGEGGFVHIDSGHVRYWPRPSDSQLAQIFREYKPTVGARLSAGTLLAMQEVVEGTPTKPLAEAKQPVLASLAALPGLPIPKPRPEVVAQVEPASAPVLETNFKPSPRPAILASAAAPADENLPVPAPVQTASLGNEEMALMLEKLQQQDEQDDEGQNPATLGGPVSNIMAKADRLKPGQLASLRVEVTLTSDPLFAADRPLPFD